MNRIYHYTSIENLALILKNRTIRFNRLDKMDDINERNYFSINKAWSNYTYVSCWTESAIESIPLWYMYTKGGIGIRIGMPQNFIDWDNMQSSILVESKQQKVAPKAHTSHFVQKNVTFAEILKKRMNDNSYHRVEYRPAAIWMNESPRIGLGETFVDCNDSDYTSHIGVYKDEKWAFQQETRFILYAAPWNKPEEMTEDDFLAQIRNKGISNAPFIDAPIKPEILNDIELLLGPNVSEGQIILLDAMLKHYLPNMKSKIRLSELSEDSFKLYNLFPESD